MDLAITKKICLLGVACVLAACGGSPSENPPSGRGAGAGEIEWQAGVFPDADQLKSRCETPRTGSNFDDRVGSSMDEKMWLRSFSDDVYLWYNEIPDQNPAPFSVLEYFDELVTTALTPSGTPRDQFHFTFDTEEWQRLSRSGISSGYGMQLAIDNRTPRSITVVYTEPNSPAANADLTRGTRILEVNGTAVDTNTNEGVAALNEGLSPSEDGESHTFLVMGLESSAAREITLVSESVTSAPVQNVHTQILGDQTVGYMLFNDHIATAEEALVDAVEQLSAADIDELVLDIRYNGGGFLTIASQLSYMIAGPTQTNNRVFELQQFNDKHPEINPITGERIEANAFESQTRGFSLAAGQALPSLNLSRVYVLTGSGTCSASESIINGLRGIDVEVIQIGNVTCGKPYGFYPIDNCGTTYFTIQFRGVNAQNFGDFSDGFTPSESGASSGANVPGCVVADDLTRALGNPEEARFATALHHIETGACSSSGSPKPLREKISVDVIEQDPQLIGVPPWRQNRLIGVPE